MINPNKIYPVLGFTVKNSIFEKGKQTVIGGCLLFRAFFLVTVFVMHDEKLYSVSFPYISCIKKSGFIECMCTMFPAYFK
jgi:hypothetical protein